MSVETVSVENPEGLNLIFGQTHFIKTCEDIYEAITQTNSNLKWGLAFCEASGECLIRTEGNDEKLIDLAVKNAQKIGAGHTFILFMDNGFPVSILNGIKQVPEVCRIFCATANPLQVIICSSQQGRGVMGVIDGYSPKGVENEKNKKDRHELLRKIKYKK